MRAVARCIFMRYVYLAETICGISSIGAECVYMPKDSFAPSAINSHVHIADMEHSACFYLYMLRESARNSTHDCNAFAARARFSKLDRTEHLMRYE